MKPIATTAAPEAVGPYAQAVDTGQIIFCSGQIGLDPKTGALVADDTATQTRQALQNMAAVLQAASLSLNDVAKTTVYVLDMDDFAAVNTVYAEIFSGHRPARACVEVAALPKNARVEIECIAVRSRSPADRPGGSGPRR